MKLPRFVVISLVIIVFLSLVRTGNTVASSSFSSDISSNHPSSPPLIPTALKPSVDFIQLGLSGTIEADIVVMELADEEEEAVLLGTSRGLYIISQGALLNYISTPNSVVDIALLDDISRDGQQDIVLAIWDTYYPNIRCLNGDTGDRLWQFIPKQEVFADNVMWTEQQTLTFDLKVMDVNNDNIQDVIATSGYQVHAVDGRTGKQIWSFQATNNLWRVAVTTDIDSDRTPDLAVGGQSGFMYVLSGKDGELLWREKVAEKGELIDRRDVPFTVDYSIWDILPVGSKGKSSQAVVSSEDGQVRLIDLRDGTIEWEMSVIEYTLALQSEYYQNKSKKPTSPGDQNFFNLRICLAPDVTGDGIEEVLASSYPGQVGEGGGGTSALFLINGASGLVVWQKIGVNLGYTSQVEIVTIEGEQVILLPQGKSGSTDEIEMLDLNDGTTLETIEIETGPESAGRNRYTVKDSGDDTFLLASDYGDLLNVSSEGVVLWDNPRITDVAVERGEFYGDEAEDLLIRSRNYLYGDRDPTSTARVLYMIDGTNRQKAWSYEMPYEEYVVTGGITGIQITPDINGDGKQDIAGFIQLPEWKRDEDEYGENSRIILLSGKDGTVLLKQPVVPETYYGEWDRLYRNKSSQSREMQQRMDKEEKNWRIQKWILSFSVAQFREGGPAPVGLMVRTPREMYLISPQGKTLMTWTYERWHYRGPYDKDDVLPAGVKPGFAGGDWSRQLVLDDINGDGGDDLATFTHQEIFISESDIGTQTGNLDYDSHLTIEVEEGIDRQNGWLADDLDGDGIREFYYYRHQENQSPMLTFVSPVTGEKLLETEYEPRRYGVDLGCADFNSDGYNDTLLFLRHIEGKEGPKLEILSGRDNSIIWEYNDYRVGHLFNMFGMENRWSTFKYACPISDISGDGVTDVALVKNLTWQPGAQIVIFDVLHDKELKSIVLEEVDLTRPRDQRWHPGVLVKEITDINGDGSKELVAIIALGNTDREKEWQLMVVDIRNDELLADFQVMGTDFIELAEGSEFGMTGLNGEVYFMDATSNLRITSPAEGSIQTSPVTVKWTGAGEGAFNQVYVDEIEVGRTNDNQYTVPVAKGEHKLTVRSVDEYGRGAYRTVSFTVDKSSSSFIHLIFWLVLIALIAFVPAIWGFIVRRRRRRV
ncbi:PQQ-binding-like beta-propeller repeat protein [Chloroflexota bacterium]